MLAPSSTEHIALKMCSRTSAREKSSTRWLRERTGACPGTASAQSGCARYSSLSSLIISGSIQTPNFSPSAFTRRASSPSGMPSFSSFTVQSPSELLSSRRAPNQPSSITSISTPSFAAPSASVSRLSPVKSKYEASQLLSRMGVLVSRYLPRRTRLRRQRW